MSQPKILQIRTKLGGYILPDTRDQMEMFNPASSYAKDVAVEYEPEVGVFLHGKRETVLIPKEHICCILFERPEPAPAKGK